MKFLTITFLMIGSLAIAQNPGLTWQAYSDPAQAGFSIEKLEIARKVYDSTKFSAALVVHQGKIVSAWGATSQRFLLASMRKSLLNALIGRAVDEGKLNLDSSLEDLGIDDNTPLTPAEKQAKVRHLLTTTSGVYLPCAFEDRGWKERKPDRGSHAAGTYWYYNNWDFNALCTIYEKSTGKKVFNSFETEVARPLQMQDFRIEDGVYATIPESQHPAYLFKMTARDLARFGTLYLNGGKWNGKQVVPKQWIAESTSAKATSGDRSYGYLWWTSPIEDRQVFTARGAGSQVIFVVPELDLVVVLLTNTYVGNSTSGVDSERVLTKILEARSGATSSTIDLITAIWPQPKVIDMIEEKIDSRFLGRYQHPMYGEFVVSKNEKYLTLGTTPARFNLLPLGNHEYFIEDMELKARFDKAMDEEQKNTCNMKSVPGSRKPVLVLYY